VQLVNAVGAALEERYALGSKSKGVPPRTPITEPKGLEIRMRRIMEKFKGNRREAARAAGVPYSTWNHALRGRNVTTRTLEKITGAFASLVTAPARALRVKRRGLPSLWQIIAVVVCQPSGSRYINGQPAGTALEDIPDPTSEPEYREFNAEGLDSGAIVDAWLAGGAAAATAKLLDEIEENYGDEFGFEGDDVEVYLYD
jgi:hypothetical protein